MYVFDNDYSISELVKIAVSLVRTKLFYRGATLVRHPFYIRGKRRMVFKKGFTTGYNCRIETFGKRNETIKKLIIGEECHIGDYVHIAAAEKVIIGNDCLMASRIFISDLDHGVYSGNGQTPPSFAPNKRPLSAKPVSIGNNVWIGEGVCVLKGVSVGDGCIIGSNSVVAKDIPPYSIAVGSPARVIKRYDFAKEQWIAMQ